MQESQVQPGVELGYRSGLGEQVQVAQALQEGQEQVGLGVVQLVESVLGSVAELRLE